MVKWGILSTAKINQAVIPAIKDDELATLYGIASRDPGRASLYAQEHGFTQSYGHYQDLLDDPDINAVFISLPNGLHYEWIMKSLQAGKHVLCEKSITTTLDEISKVKQAASETKKWVMEGFMYRYHPYFQKIKELVDSDLIGELRNIQISRAAWQLDSKDIRLQPGLGPGVMGDVGCYCLNFCRTLYGYEPSAWDARVHYNENGVDMEALVTLLFSARQTAQIFCSFTALGSFASIIGSNGRLQILEPFWSRTGERALLYISKDGKTEKQFHVTAERTGHDLEVRDFTRAVLENRPPYLSLDDSENNIKIMQDVVESSSPLLT
jgi:predicted dehydrogenase